MLVLIGSPHGEVRWSRIEESLSHTTRAEDFELPWDGRVILLKVSTDGTHWTMWNDWVGSIPVFQCHIDRGRVCSTLEPAVVAAAGFSSADIFLPGLLSLLINGHLMADWTLFKGMTVVPPDSAAEWDCEGFRWKELWTVKPTRDRWETSWDDLVDEMHELSRAAIASVLNTQSSWILPLSSGLDSRLIAAVGADLGSNMHAYAWGEADSTDVVYSRQIARALGLPWKRVELGTDYLAQYTKRWADLFGSGLHFHGMYQMAFLDALGREPANPVVSGFLGEILTGDDLSGLVSVHSMLGRGQLLTDAYTHWTAEEITPLFRSPCDAAIEGV
ncbi:MAG: asparagine synthase-related protein, partial [Candidatus Nanopelagicales bacterium]|nr:asparagine synthase-related protein [Candidatus Nanopelagicales bacterium]